MLEHGLRPIEPRRGSRRVTPVVIVTADAEVAAAFRDLLPAAPIVAPASATALADLVLASGGLRALGVDGTAAGRHTATVVRHMAARFPDVKIVVIGSPREAALLVPLLAAGQIALILHPPLLPAAVRTFISAALDHAALDPRERRPAASRASVRHLRTAGAFA